MKSERVLVFGGTGSLGKKLIERWGPTNNVNVYSRDEAKHWTIKNDIRSETWRDCVRFTVGDIRDPHRVKDVVRTYMPTVIIIAAALKQVDTCELSPYESVQTNLLGTQNVISAINELSNGQLGRFKVLFVSTDKACQPVNAYGMSKALSERLITSQYDRGTFLCTRYGNVLDSRGSIIPLFRSQVRKYDRITVTHPDMTRFLMTLDESVDLIQHTLTYGQSGETWIPQLKSMKIGDLANIFARRYDRKVEIVGHRPGEKMHEDLISQTEALRTYTSQHCPEKRYVIKRSTAQINEDASSFSYSSDGDVLTESELEKYLDKLGVFDKPIDSFVGRSIEEIER